jgi:hypothetical protein
LSLSLISFSASLRFIVSSSSTPVVICICKYLNCFIMDISFSFYLRISDHIF